MMLFKIILLLVAGSNANELDQLRDLAAHQDPVTKESADKFLRVVDKQLKEFAIPLLNDPKPNQLSDLIKSEGDQPPVRFVSDDLGENIYHRVNYKDEWNTRFAWNDNAHRLGAAQRGYMAQSVLRAFPLETLQYAWLLNDKKAWVKSTTCPDLESSPKMSRLFDNSEKGQNHLIALVKALYGIANCGSIDVSVPWKRDDETQIKQANFETFLPSIPRTAIDASGRVSEEAIRDDAAILKLQQNNECSMQFWTFLKKYSDSASESMQKFEELMHGCKSVHVRFISKVDAQNLVSPKVSPELAQSVLAKIPRETLEFGKLVLSTLKTVDFNKYSAVCDKSTAFILPEDDATKSNYLGPLLLYFRRASQCSDPDWELPQAKDIDSITLAEFQKKYEGTDSPGPGTEDATADIQSVLTLEGNLLQNMADVSTLMTSLGQTSIQGAANVQILNTYIDLVQRAMIQIASLDEQMALVTKAQALVKGQITTLLVN